MLASSRLSTRGHCVVWCLSWRKAATVLDLAQRFSDRRLSETELRELPDQEVIRQLTDVKGIGAWTVQGALLIALQRPDVIRPDDLAPRHAVQARYGLDHLPDPAEVADLAIDRPARRPEEIAELIVSLWPR